MRLVRASIELQACHRLQLSSMYGQEAAFARNYKASGSIMRRLLSEESQIKWSPLHHLQILGRSLFLHQV